MLCAVDMLELESEIYAVCGEYVRVGKRDKEERTWEEEGRVYICFGRGGEGGAIKSVFSPL